MKLNPVIRVAALLTAGAAALMSELDPPGADPTTADPASADLRLGLGRPGF